MRTIWKGSLNFGLLSIPVNLYPASKEREVSFVMLHKNDLSEIRYAKICKTEEKEIDYKEIVKGYEVEKGNYVVLTDEDFQKASPEKSKSIEILDFTDEDQIDSVYYEKPYFLEPGKGASKPYMLLREALHRTKKVAIARYIFKNHERIGVIKVYQNALVLNQLRYHDELVNLEKLELPKKEALNPKEIGMAVQLVDQLTEKFEPEKYQDTYVEDLKKIIDQKAKGKKIIPKKGVEKAAPTKVHDIMSLLKASLKEKEKAVKKEPAKRKAR